MTTEMKTRYTLEDRNQIRNVLNAPVFDDGDEWTPNFHELFRFTKKELLDIVSTLVIPNKPKNKKDILGLFLQVYCYKNDILPHIENYIRREYLRLEPI